MGKNIANTTHTFLFCDGGSCQKAGSEKVVREARAYLRNNNLWDTTHTIKTRCNGRCEDAPTCVVTNGDFWYKDLTTEKITPILKSHIFKGEPVVSDLLYQKGWDEVKSENERAKIVPKPFVLKSNQELGEYQITKGFSSDQYLFPLFQYISDNKPKGFLTLSSDEVYNLQEVATVIYEEQFTMDLKFINEENVTLTVGAIPKTVAAEVKNKKITSTEYLVLASGDKMIQLKNNKSVLIASIQLPKEETKMWDYCTNIQLGGIKPQIFA